MRERQRKTTRRERRRSSGAHRRGATVTALPSELDERLVGDPAFLVTTTDRSTWFDPYSGDAIPVEGTVVETARGHIQASEAWREMVPLELPELQQRRWAHELRARMNDEERFRLFSRSGRGWLNPFAGTFHPEVDREDGLVTPQTIQAMARVLAICPHAAHGVMQSREDLVEMLRATTTIHRRSPDEAPAVEERTPLQNDLSKARDVQARMLGELPALPGYDLGVHYAPQQEVSGDFYDVIDRGDGRHLLVLGDVTGHGMQAALVATTALKALRLITAQGLGDDLVELACAINDNVKDDLLSGQFITLSLMLLDTRSHRLTSLLAGHHPAVVANTAPLGLREFGHKGAAVGILPSATLRRVLTVDTIELRPGDILLQYTDGVTEAMDRAGEEFGAHRLAAAVFAHATGSMQALTDGLAAACQAHEAAAAADDVTVLALRRVSDPDHPD